MCATTRIGCEGGSRERCVVDKCGRDIARNVCIYVVREKVSVAGDRDESFHENAATAVKWIISVEVFVGLRVFISVECLIPETMIRYGDKILGVC